MISRKNRLLMAVTLLLVSGFLVTSLASYLVSRSSLRSEIIFNSLPLTSDNIYSEIQRDMLRPIFISSLMANDTFLKDWVTHGENDTTRISRYLREIKKRYNTVSSFFVSDKTRKYYYPDGVLKTISPNEKRDTWYYRVRAMNTDYEINVDYDMANRDTLTIFINYKVFDDHGSYIGATGVGLTVNAVKERINSYQKRYQRNIFFVNNIGDITLHGFGFPENVTSIKQIEGLSGLVQSILSSESSTYKYEKNSKTFHLNTRFIKEFNWYLLVEQSEDDSVKPLLNALILNLFICFIITGIVFLLLKPAITSYQKKIEKLATTDLLTGLHNRLSFNILIEQALKEIKRKKSPLSIVLMDIDHFKLINDTYGHGAGDIVLRKLSLLIQSQLRDSDVLCRWGGEEFLVLLKDCDVRSAYSTAEKIRANINDEKIAVNDSEISVSMSLGVSQYHHGEDIGTVIERADKAMYAAKEKGRNRSEKM